MRRPLAILTGGTGFIGRYIARSLATQGWRIRLLVRQDPVHPQLADLCPEVVFGELQDQSSLRLLVRDADAVIHAAGLIKARSDHEFFLANVTGSERIGQAMRQYAPEARLIVISSLAAREPQLSPYAASKRAGEEAAIAASGAASWIVLRPSATYGPWDRETLRVFQAASRKLLPVPAGNGRITMVHVKDLAEAVTAVAAERGLHGTFEVTDSRPEGYSWREIANAMAEALGYSPMLVPVPPALMRLAMPALYAARLFGGAVMLTPGKLREVLHDWSSAPTAQLPPQLWAPKIDLDRGLSETARWYIDQGWLTPAARP